MAVRERRGRPAVRLERAIPQRANASGHERDATWARGHTRAACHALLAPRLHARRRRAARPHQRRIVEGLASRGPTHGHRKGARHFGQVLKREPGGFEQQDACLLGASTSPPKVARCTEGIQTGKAPERLAPSHLIGRTTLDVALRCRDQAKRHSEEHSDPDLLNGRVFSELLLGSRHTQSLRVGASFCDRREKAHQTPV